MIPSSNYPENTQTCLFKKTVGIFFHAYFYKYTIGQSFFKFFFFFFFFLMSVRKFEHQIH